MHRLWRSNSSVISRTGCPPDIVNEEDHTVEDKEFPDFQKWNIPKVDTKIVYKTSWTENKKCLFNSSHFVNGIESSFNKTSLINRFSINFRNIPFSEIRDLMFFNIVIFFIYNIRRTTSPGADRRVGSSQSFHTILGSTLNYHVFLNTVAFRNTYPSQPYTSHALHAFLAQTSLTVRFWEFTLRLRWRQRW